MKFKYLPWFYIVLLAPSLSCKQIKVLTAKDYAPKMETAKSVEAFMKSKNIDGFPVFRYDTTFPDSLPPFLFDFGLFNWHGDYISLNDASISCRVDDYNYLVLREILQNGDSLLRKEYVKTSYLSYPLDSIQLIEYINNHKVSKSEWDSLFVLYGESQIIKMNLKQYADHFITLEGGRVDTDSLFTHYILLQEFSIAGESSLWAMRIKYLIRDIQKLNKEFNNQIQLVLINTDLQYSFASDP